MRRQCLSSAGRAASPCVRRRHHKQPWPRRGKLCTTPAANGTQLSQQPPRRLSAVCSLLCPRSGLPQLFCSALSLPVPLCSGARAAAGDSLMAAFLGVQPAPITVAVVRPGESVPTGLRFGRADAGVLPDFIARLTLPVPWTLCCLVRVP